MGEMAGVPRTSLYNALKAYSIISIFLAEITQREVLYVNYSALFPHEE